MNLLGLGLYSDVLFLLVYPKLACKEKKHGFLEPVFLSKCRSIAFRRLPPTVRRLV
jgi:hypothetical protein